LAAATGSIPESSMKLYTSCGCILYSSSR
jgi:hypothetical protein